VHTLPARAELTFVRTVASDTVHIVLSVPASATDEEPEAMSLGEGLAALAAGQMPTTVLCGRQTHPAPSGRHEHTGRFADDDLCRACYRALPADDQWRAFEHPQSAA
jgi:hypothetical protein